MTSSISCGASRRLSADAPVGSDRDQRQARPTLGALSGYRVGHHGLWCDVRGSDFSPQVRAQMFWGIREGAETRMVGGLLAWKHDGSGAWQQSRRYLGPISQH